MGGEILKSHHSNVEPFDHHSSDELIHDSDEKYQIIGEHQFTFKWKHFHTKTLLRLIHHRGWIFYAKRLWLIHWKTSSRAFFLFYYAKCPVREIVLSHRCIPNKRHVINVISLWCISIFRPLVFACMLLLTSFLRLLSVFSCFCSFCVVALPLL